MTPPKISVVIPSLNKGKYIGKTLASIFSQKYSNLEVVVQDGGSTDGSLKIIKRFVKKYPKIIKFVSKKDKGQLDAINRGMRKATGDILCFINADDIYAKHSFTKLARSYAKNLNALWFAGHGRVINDKGDEIVKLITLYKNILLSLNFRFNLLVTNYLMQPSVFITKKAFQKYGPFTGTKDFVMEYDLWLKISEKEMPIIINSNLSKFRMEASTITKRMSSKLIVEDEKVVSRYSKNKFIIFLHRLINKARMVVGKFI